MFSIKVCHIKYKNLIVFGGVTMGHHKLSSGGLVNTIAHEGKPCWTSYKAEGLSTLSFRLILLFSKVKGHLRSPGSNCEKSVTRNFIKGNLE